MILKVIFMNVIETPTPGIAKHTRQDNHITEKEKALRLCVAGLLS